MLAVTIETLLTLIEGLLPELGAGAATGVVNQILQALIAIVPIIAANATDFLTPVKNIIAALQSSGAVSQDQITQLQQLDAQCDAAFEAAAKNAGV
jgi:hypothetical protein